jgi:hypothetical protein
MQSNQDLRWPRKRDFITDASKFDLLLIKTIKYINLRHNKVPLPKDIDNQII